MRYRAIFFDRDGTLTYNNPEKEAFRDRTIALWSGRPFSLPYEKQMRLFALAAENRVPWYKNLEDERAFFKRYYRAMLREEGVTEDLDARAETLFAALWCNHDRLLYPEVVGVLESLCAKGYRLGVISDTSPSLEYTLRQLGVARYFTSFTASSLVGVGKPDPRIYNAALRAQGATAGESLYVDDCEAEAEGARRLGFTAFHLDRSGRAEGRWTVTDLTQLVRFVEESENAGR